MHKKGQAALEFLTTYGWAFLIILVMVGGFTYFGVFDISTTESCVSSVEFTCQSSLTTDKYQTITLRNNLPEDIIIHNATLTKNGANIGTCIHNQNIPPETQFQIYCVTNQTTNKKETLNIQITYYSATGNPAYAKTITTTLKTSIKSATEIAQNGQTPEPPISNLVAHYKFDEGSGTTIQDSSAYSRHATAYNSYVWRNESDCKLGKCLEFNSPSAHVRTNTAYSFESDTQTISLVVWVYYASRSGGGTIFSEAYQGAQPFLFTYVYPTDALHTQWATGVSYTSTRSNDNFFPTNNWVHLVLVFDYTNKQIHYYKNGVLDITKNLTGTVLFPNTSRFKYFGSYSGSGDFFRGRLDDFRIYNKALSNAEINVLYNLN